MNDNLNNSSGFSSKPINRVVTPIRVDASGNRIIEVKPEVNKEIEKTEPVQIIKKEQVKKPKLDSTTLIFIAIIIIILDILVAFIGFVILPRYVENKRGLPFNDVTTTTQKNQ